MTKMTKNWPKTAKKDSKWVKIVQKLSKSEFNFSQKGPSDKEIESAKSSIFELILIIDNINSS